MIDEISNAYYFATLSDGAEGCGKIITKALSVEINYVNKLVILNQSQKLVCVLFPNTGCNWNDLISVLCTNHSMIYSKYNY